MHEVCGKPGWTGELHATYAFHRLGKLGPRDCIQCFVFATSEFLQMRWPKAPIKRTVL